MSMNPAEPGTIIGLSPAAFTSMFRSIDGLRNRRALVAMLGCMVVGVLGAGLFSLLAAHLGVFMALLGGLFMFVATAAGINAAGVLLMDQARGLVSRSLADAVVYGLLCIPKFVVLTLALVLVAIGVFVVLAFVYFVCRLPGLGPILFVVVFPLSVVISGLTLWGLFLCMLLALPAIWEGATITRAVAQTLAIARNRLVEAVLLLALVGLLAGVVGLIVSSVLFSGLMPSIGLSASVLGGDGLTSMLGMMRQGGTDFGAGGDAGSAGYAVAAGVGAALLWALAGSLLSLVALLGLNLVYLRVTEGLDVGATEAALKTTLDEAKRQAADLGQKARDAAERAREPARQAAAAAQAGTAAATREAAAAPPPPAPPLPPLVPGPRELPPGATTPGAAKVPTCPQCLSSIGPDDVFCGVCGHRLT
jgi:hypothetical protein